MIAWILAATLALPVSVAVPAITPPTHRARQHCGKNHHHRSRLGNGVRNRCAGSRFALAEVTLQLYLLKGDLPK